MVTSFGMSKRLVQDWSHLVPFGMMHNETGAQRLTTPSVRLSVEFLVCFNILDSPSVRLHEDPRFNTLSSSTSGVYLRTRDNSIKPGSERKSNKHEITKDCRSNNFSVRRLINEGCGYNSEITRAHKNFHITSTYKLYI